MTTFATQIVQVLEDFGCTKAFGVSGGYVFPLWHSLESSEIQVYHCRSEGGATFSAMEHSLHTDTPAAVFVTSGPGLTNALTALRSARADGAKVILLSAITTETEQDPTQMQETSPSFVKAVTGESPQLPFSRSFVMRNHHDFKKLRNELETLCSGKSNTLGVFLSQKTQLSSITVDKNLCQNRIVSSPSDPNLPHWIQMIRSKLQQRKFVIWAGYGAKRSANHLLELAEAYETPVMTTPRAKGVFPEAHPLSWGCTGIGGNIEGDVQDAGSDWGVIVLGSRLEDMSSSLIQLGWNEREIIAVTNEPQRIKRNLPSNALIIETDIVALLSGLAGAVNAPKPPKFSLKPYSVLREKASSDGIHPVSVMSAVQKIAVDKHGYFVIADIGNTLCWTTRYLKFNIPGVFRVSTHDATMTHAACGAVGIGSNNTPVIAIVGDGAMIMQNEVSTAVQHQLPIIWLVMNDSRYNMCEQGFNIDGAKVPDCSIPLVDFAKYGAALGARGLSVEVDEDIDEALHRAISWKSPTVIDVRIDGRIPAPLGSRLKALPS